MAFLDLCLLQTSYQMLWIIPHSFCQGGSATNVGTDRASSRSATKVAGPRRVRLLSLTHNQIWWQCPQSKFLMRLSVITEIGHSSVCTTCLRILYRHQDPKRITLREFFPDFMQSFGPVMLTAYPHPVVISKMKQEEEDAESEFFLKLWVEIAEAKKREHERRSKLASAQHKDRNRRIKGDVIPACYSTTAGDISRVKCSVAVQTDISAVRNDQKDECIQTMPLLDQCMAEEGEKSGGRDVHLNQAEFSKAQVHPEAEAVFLSQGVARYPLKIDGRMHLLS